MSALADTLADERRLRRELELRFDVVDTWRERQIDREQARVEIAVKAARRASSRERRAWAALALAVALLSVVGPHIWPAGIPVPAIAHHMGR